MATNYMHLHSTQTQLLQHLWLDPHINPSGGLWWTFLAETVIMVTLLAVYTEESRLRRFPPLELHKGVLNSSRLLIRLIHNKHKYNEL